jgi:hypothetical protein
MFRLAALLLALSSAVLAQSPQRGGALPQPLPLFPPGNWWNADITAAPVDPTSSAFIADVGATRGMHPDFGGDSGDPSAPIYGMPYIVVSGSQPLLPVTFDYAERHRRAGASARLSDPRRGQDAAEMDRGWVGGE